MTTTLEQRPDLYETHEMTASEREEARRRLDEMLGITNPVPGAAPFYETATVEEWITAFHLWTSSMDPNTPVLLDDSREGIYED